MNNWISCSAWLIFVMAAHSQPLQTTQLAVQLFQVVSWSEMLALKLHVSAKRCFRWLCSWQPNVAVDVSPKLVNPVKPSHPWVVSMLSIGLSIGQMHLVGYWSCHCDNLRCIPERSRREVSGVDRVACVELLESYLVKYWISLRVSMQAVKWRH